MLALGGVGGPLLLPVDLLFSGLRVTVTEVDIIYKSGDNYRIGCTNTLIEDSCIKSFLTSVLQTSTVASTA